MDNMKHLVNRWVRASAGLMMICVAVSGCDKEDSEVQPTIFSANGNITTAVTEFKNLLGPVNNTTGMTTGRREINWDGVPDSLDGQKLPNDFFNPIDNGAPASLKKGIVYAGPNDAMVSQTNFAEINPNASGSFSTFSGNKSFAVVNSIEWPVTFEKAGQHTPATIKGFGAVFSDVDEANSTFIEFFNDNTSLGRFYVPAKDNTTSFSFLAVYFPDKVVTRVQIGHEGKLTDGESDITQGGTRDLVVLDDFIYSEPLPR
jgi:hypothetical protein